MGRLEVLPQVQLQFTKLSLPDGWLMILVFPHSWINLEIRVEGPYLLTDNTPGFCLAVRSVTKNMKDDQQLVCLKLAGKQMG